MTAGKGGIRWATCRSLARLAILLVLGLSMLGMLAYARGAEHHRGDEVGSHGTAVTMEAPS